MSLVLPRSRATFMPGWVRDDLWRRARAVPSLDLRFADSKSLVDAVSGQSLITFTRASSGTYIDSQGVLRTAAINEPRFDHNPTTGECLGLLVEEQRTNLLLRSEEFDGASWLKLNGLTVAANAIAAPNGAITADKIVEPASSADKPVVQPVTLVASTTYTASLYIKAAERPAILFHVRKSDYLTRFGGFFNTSTNTFTTETASGGVLDSFTFSNVGGGWYRCSITGNIGANTAGIVTIYIVNSSNNLTYTGDGTSGIYIWGAQLEAGASPTSYIPTTSSAATRSADVASITGSNFSSWYSSSQGALHVEYSIPFDSSTSIFPLIAGFSDGTFNNAVLHYNRTVDDGRRAIVRSVGVTRFDQANSTAYVYGQTGRQAFAYAGSDFALSAAGASPTVSTSIDWPTVNQGGIGSTAFVGGALSSLNGHIRRLVYWGQRLPNNVLQDITL